MIEYQMYKKRRNVRNTYLCFMTEAQLYQLSQWLSEPSKMVIIPHKNPDGDAMGSTLGLYHYLKLYNHHL